MSPLCTWITSCLSGTRTLKNEWKVEVTWWNLRTIAHSIVLHALVLDKYINFTLMHTNHHIYPVLPINHLVKQYGKPTTPHKLATGKKPSV